MKQTIRVYVGTEMNFDPDYNNPEPSFVSSIKEWIDSVIAKGATNILWRASTFNEECDEIKAQAYYEREESDFEYELRMLRESENEKKQKERELQKEREQYEYLKKKFAPHT